VEGAVERHKYLVRSYECELIGPQGVVRGQIRNKIAQVAPYINSGGVLNIAHSFVQQGDRLHAVHGVIEG
jgi:hypothetical protein